MTEPPVPELTPGPHRPDAADTALVATLGPWANEHHTGRDEIAARAFITWRLARGY
jgi:hypothetical protein